VARQGDATDLRVRVLEEAQESHGVNTREVASHDSGDDAMSIAGKQGNRIKGRYGRRHVVPERTHIILEVEEDT
jgi:hypothetical protein